MLYRSRIISNQQAELSFAHVAWEGTQVEGTLRGTGFFIRFVFTIARIQTPETEAKHTIPKYVSPVFDKEQTGHSALGRVLACGRNW